MAAGRPTYSPRGKNPELGVNQLIGEWISVE